MEKLLDTVEPEIYFPPYDPNRSERYEILKRVGEGSFGEVRKGIDKYTGKQVALKYVRSMGAKGISRATFRELTLLRQFDHPRITRLLDVFPDESNVVLVQEYFISDLAEVIEQSHDAIPRSHFKLYATMLLDALQFIHSQGVIHRDIKPSNVLIGADGGLRLGDFGLARIMPKDNGSMSHQVATRWYRAPELLLGARHYDASSDMWSAAAVLIELLILRPLFPGNNDIEQLYKVTQIMGSPTPERWPSVVDLPDYGKLSFPDTPALDLCTLFPMVHHEDLTFIQAMLQLEPSIRLTAKQALEHEYFSNIPLPCDSYELRIFPRNKAEKSTRRVVFDGGAPVLKFDNPSPLELIQRTLQLT